MLLANTNYAAFTIQQPDQALRIEFELGPRKGLPDMRISGEDFSEFVLRAGPQIMRQAQQELLAIGAADPHTKRIADERSRQLASERRIIAVKDAALRLR